MSTIPLKVVQQARIAIDLLTPKDRACLEQAVTRLEGQAPENWPQEIVEPLQDDQPLYLLHFTPDMRAFVVPTGNGEIEVQQIFHRNILKWFRPAKVTAYREKAIDPTSLPSISVSRS